MAKNKPVECPGGQRPAAVFTDVELMLALQDSRTLFRTVAGGGGPSGCDPNTAALQKKIEDYLKQPYRKPT